MAQALRFVGRSVGDRVILGFVILLAIVWIVPIAWVVILSFKANNELMVSTALRPVLWQPLRSAKRRNSFCEDAQRIAAPATAWMMYRWKNR
jgi:ABC-type glycerol-3-phosphate transport system permease component